MALNLTNCRLLLNAESFGFGPTAAIASFFPLLKGQVERISYIGDGHSLDLQKPLDYDAIYDSSNMRNTALEGILKQYDVFLTATDFIMAEKAKAAGLRVIIYDPLTWFWKDMPNAVKGCDLYLSQDFIGVGKLLKGYREKMKGEAVAVPPILQSKMPEREGQHVLLNFGGLMNPFWSEGDAIAYAEAMYKAVVDALPEGEELIVCASEKVAEALPHIHAQSYPREEMLKILEGSKYAFMTSGLGNIYDAAQFDLPTVWLPPTNDSQGQQLDMIASEGYVDIALTWHDLLGIPELDYRQEQAKVIADIVNCVGKLPSVNLNFNHALKQVSAQDSSRAKGLIDVYGTSGDEAVASVVLGFIEKGGQVCSA
ncbi:MAG: hypothetical protein VX730_00390 [Pseudomonadota bacterium]|nr:hypothetical protein [Pseudomonadota bacterium]